MLKFTILASNANSNSTKAWIGYIHVMPQLIVDLGSFSFSFQVGQSWSGRVVAQSLYLGFKGKHGRYSAKTEQNQLKERRNEDLRIAEPIRRVAKRSYPRLLFHRAEPWIRADSQKIEMVKHWRDIRSFLGLAGYYNRTEDQVDYNSSLDSTRRFRWFVVYCDASMHPGIKRGNLFKLLESAGVTHEGQPFPVVGPMRCRWSSWVGNTGKLPKAESRRGPTPGGWVHSPWLRKLEEEEEEEDEEEEGDGS
ncbi:hypothetical protein MTR67_052275 [Solanum verrucosum]|uniref:Uncharacterized protein n=1 Tax=Solanum verrucosum TaxID=315347 RepID=A0AAF0V6N5_SOLVR|nr:hypothetical protein MTR67_052275 [Solanum verrucosum]